MLAMPGALEKFVDSEADVAEIRAFFTGLYSLDFVSLGRGTVFTNCTFQV